jgi:hypothetical protein
VTSPEKRTAAQIAVFADPNSPAAMTGGFYAVSAIHHDKPLVAETFWVRLVPMMARIFNYLITIVFLSLAAWTGWSLYQRYINYPWTRDSQSSVPGTGPSNQDDSFGPVC